MGKRSDFERIPQDKYPTPLSAVMPLLRHLPTMCQFVEPCAGDGRLIRHLEGAGHSCIGAFDVEPDGPGIRRGNACAIKWANPGDAIFITNPPWKREVLHPIIQHLSLIAPTWLLFDAGWMYTRQAVRLLPYCHKAVAVGRVQWIEGTGMTAKDDCAWHFFDRRRTSPHVEFHGLQ